MTRIARGQRCLVLVLLAALSSTTLTAGTTAQTAERPLEASARYEDGDVVVELTSPGAPRDLTLVVLHDDPSEGLVIDRIARARVPGDTSISVTMKSIPPSAGLEVRAYPSHVKFPSPPGLHDLVDVSRFPSDLPLRSVAVKFSDSEPVMVRNWRVGTYALRDVDSIHEDRILVMADGTIAHAYQVVAKDNDGTHIFVRFSLDGGHTFGEPVELDRIRGASYARWAIAEVGGRLLSVSIAIVFRDSTYDSRPINVTLLDFRGKTETLRYNVGGSPYAVFRAYSPLVLKPLPDGGALLVFQGDGYIYDPLTRVSSTGWKPLTALHVWQFASNGGLRYVQTLNSTADRTIQAFDLATSTTGRAEILATTTSPSESGARSLLRAASPSLGSRFQEFETLTTSLETPAAIIGIRDLSLSPSGSLVGILNWREGDRTVQGPFTRGPGGALTIDRLDDDATHAEGTLHFGSMRLVQAGSKNYVFWSGGGTWGRLQDEQSGGGFGPPFRLENRTGVSLFSLFDLAVGEFGAGSPRPILVGQLPTYTGARVVLTPLIDPVPSPSADLIQIATLRAPGMKMQGPVRVDWISPASADFDPRVPQAFTVALKNAGQVEARGEITIQGLPPGIKIHRTRDPFPFALAPEGTALITFALQSESEANSQSENRLRPTVAVTVLGYGLSDERSFELVQGVPIGSPPGLWISEVAGQAVVDRSLVVHGAHGERSADGSALSAILAQIRIDPRGGADFLDPQGAYARWRSAHGPSLVLPIEWGSGDDAIEAGSGKARHVGAYASKSPQIQRFDIVEVKLDLTSFGARYWLPPGGWGMLDILLPDSEPSSFILESPERLDKIQTVQLNASTTPRSGRALHLEAQLPTEVEVEVLNTARSHVQGSLSFSVPPALVRLATGAPEQPIDLAPGKRTTVRYTINASQLEPLPPEAELTIRTNAPVGTHGHERRFSIRFFPESQPGNGNSSLSIASTTAIPTIPGRDTEARLIVTLHNGDRNRTALGHLLLEGEPEGVSDARPPVGRRYALAPGETGFYEIPLIIGDGAPRGPTQIIVKARGEDGTTEVIETVSITVRSESSEPPKPESVASTPGLSPIALAGAAAVAARAFLHWGARRRAERP